MNPIFFINLFGFHEGDFFSIPYGVVKHSEVYYIEKKEPIVYEDIPTYKVFYRIVKGASGLVGDVKTCISSRPAQGRGIDVIKHKPTSEEISIIAWLLA